MVGYVSSGAMQADEVKQFALNLRRRAHRLMRQGELRAARYVMRRALVEWRLYRIRRERAHADGYRWPHERTGQ